VNAFLLEQGIVYRVSSLDVAHSTLVQYLREDQDMSVRQGDRALRRGGEGGIGGEVVTGLD